MQKVNRIHQQRFHNNLLFMVGMAYTVNQPNYTETWCFTQLDLFTIIELDLSNITTTKFH